MSNATNSTPDEYWSGVAAEWDGGARDRLWRRHSDAVNAALIGRWLAPLAGQRILKTDAFDEVCSEGLYPVLSRVAGEVVGIDLSARAVEVASKRYPEWDVKVGDVRGLPFGAASFDGIVSLSTLDHFTRESDIASALAEFHRVLRPDGTLLLTMDNLDNPVVRMRNGLPFPLVHRLGLVPYFVGVTFGREALNRRIEDAGFTIAETTAVLHCPRAIAVPVARWFRRHGSEAMQHRLLRSLLRFEGLERFSTRFRTGHFVAVRAFKSQ